MKKLLLLSCLIVFTLQTWAQSLDGFIKVYDDELPPDYKVLVSSLNTIKYGYILSGSIIDSVNAPTGYWGVALLGIDFNGNKLWQKNYENNTDFWYYSSCELLTKNEKDYYLMGVTFDKLDTENYYYQTTILLKLNDKGDTLWTRRFRGDIVEDSIFSVFHFNMLPDSDFAAIGLSENPCWDCWYPIEGGGDVTDWKSFLLRLDSDGNELWRKKYTPNIIIYSNGLAYYTSTKRHVVVGSKYINPHPDEELISVTLITDSLGNIIHKQNYVPEELWDVKQLHDGNFIACGTRAVLVKFDIDGNLIWNKQFEHTSDYAPFYKVEVLENDEILAVGLYDTIRPYYDNNYMITLCKFISDGELIWRRLINLLPDPAVAIGYEYPNRMVLTPDGGVAISAWTFSSPQLGYILVKTDPWDCIEEGCQDDDTNYCNGETVFTDYKGVFDNGSGENKLYANNTSCSWTIAPDSGDEIVLSFNYLETEENIDEIRLFNGETEKFIMSLSGILQKMGERI